MLKRLLTIPVFTMMLCTAQNAFAQNDEAFDPDYLNYMLTGIEYYNGGQEDPSKYFKAIEHFMTASKLSDDPEPYLFIGQTYMELNDCDNALRAFRDYKKRAGNIPNFEQNPEVDEYIATLDEQCGIKQGELAAICSPAQTLMKIDNNDPVPCSEVVRLSTGMHSVVFSLDGYKSITRSITSKQNERITFEVTMNKDRSTAKIASTLSIAEAQEADSRKAANAMISDDYFKGDDSLISHGYLWGGIAASAVGIALTITGGVVFDSAYTLVNKSSSTYEFDEDKKTAGIALFAVGSVVTVAGVVLMIYDAIDQRKTESERYDKVRNQVVMRPTFSIGEDAASAGVHITF